MKNLRFRVYFGGTLLLGLLIGGPARGATTFRVTDCSNDSELQAAVTAANLDNAGDIITFGCNRTIPITSTLTITGSMTVDGGQLVTLDGQGLRRVLSVNSGVTLTLNALTIANGFSSDRGGGILNNGTLIITNSTFSGNSVHNTDTGPGPSTASGGGIENSGTLSITNSTFSKNSATAGFSAAGGGISNSGGTLSVINCMFSGNNSASGQKGVSFSNGGGIFSSGGRMSIDGSTFSDNRAGGFENSGGGGIANVVGILIITNSTFSKNSASGLEGGADGGGIENSGTLSITNSTFSGNSANSGIKGSGGGIRNSGTLSLTNSTFSGNFASTHPSFPYASPAVGGGISNSGALSIVFSTFSGNSADIGGGGGISGGTVDMRGSIVANNTGGDCAGVILTDEGYNLESGFSCGFTGTGSLQNTDPKLKSLQNNGGPTQTMALEPDSPAIDQIPLSGCIATDQRGVSRPQGPACDMGAFELRQGNVNAQLSSQLDPSSFAFDPTPVTGGPAGTFSFTARFCNTGSEPLTGLKSITTTLTGGDELFNRDTASPPGVGSELTFPKTGDYAGGVLSPGKCVDVHYIIALAARTPFTFNVDVVSVDD